VVKAGKSGSGPNFERAVMIDFQGPKLTSDVSFLLMREIDDRFRIITPLRECVAGLRSPALKKHSLVQMIPQRIYQIETRGKYISSITYNY